jgi:hypothetical protein
MKKKRKPIPKAIEHQVREECFQACANPTCRKWNTATHELHHIDGDRSNSVYENLILLCANCHKLEQAGIITAQEITIWKSRAKIGRLPLPKEAMPPMNSVQGDNYGVMAERIEKLTIKLGGGKSKSSEVFPATIGANADMREYANRLVKRYIDWRKNSEKYWPDTKRKPFSPSSAHGILCEGFGSQSVLRIPDHRFEAWVCSAQKKIDRTIFGQQQPKNYSTWEEFLKERHQGIK